MALSWTNSDINAAKIWTGRPMQAPCAWRGERVPPHILCREMRIGLLPLIVAWQVAWHDKSTLSPAVPAKFPSCRFKEKSPSIFLTSMLCVASCTQQMIVKWSGNLPLIQPYALCSSYWRCCARCIKLSNQIHRKMYFLRVIQALSKMQSTSLRWIRICGGQTTFTGWIMEYLIFLVVQRPSCIT